MTDLASEVWVTEFEWLESAGLVGEMRHTQRTTPVGVGIRAHAIEGAPAPRSGVIEFSVYGALLITQISWVLFLGYVLQTFL